MKFKIHLIFILGLFITHSSKADQCIDYLALSNGEDIYDYGIDSTGHWFALTAPFTDQYRLIVDGKDYGVYTDVKPLVFSNDGNKWACFAKTNVDWRVVTNDTVIDLAVSNVGEMLFTPNSEHLIYSWFEGADEVINWIDKKIRVINRSGKLYSTWGGERYAFLGMRGNSYVININGTETSSYDAILPIGFWSDGSFLYGARNGDYWEVYFKGEPLDELYSEIYEVAMNITGTVAGLLVRRSLNDATGIILSDNYYEPLVGKPYDWVGNMVLHPEVELLAYKAMYHGNYVAVLNNTDYFGGNEVGSPRFTHDGSEMYFTGNYVNYFVNIGGRRYNLPTEIDLGLNYAMKPGSRSIAYSTSITMVVRYLETNELYAGNIVDEIIQPIYNRRTERYETLGRIGKRLYLMTCKVL